MALMWTFLDVVIDRWGLNESGGCVWLWQFHQLDLSSPPLKHFVVRCDWSPSTSIWNKKKKPAFHRDYTILREEKKNKEPHHEKNDCCAGTWPWWWLLSSVSVACVLMRPLLNWNWGPTVSLVSLAHGCVANYAKLLALAYLVLSLTIWRKPACNGSLLLDVGSDAKNTSLHPHRSNIYDTFVLSVLQRGGNTCICNTAALHSNTKSACSSACTCVAMATWKK